MAGRTFQCTQCQRTLKIGAPAAPPAQPAQWGGQPQQQQQQPMTPQQQQQMLQQQRQAAIQGRAPQAPAPRQQEEASSYELAPDPDDPDGLWNSLEDEQAPGKGKRTSGDHMVDNVRQRASQRNKQRKSGSSQGKTSARGKKTSSRQGKTSATGKTSARSKKTSARSKRSGSAREGRASDRGASPPKRAKGPVTRSCPLCDETIAAIAAECPHCGVSLREPSAFDGLGEQVKQLLVPVVGLVGLGAICFYVYSTVTAEKKPPKRGKRVATAKKNPTKTEAKTEPKTEPAKTSAKTSAKTGKTVAKTSQPSKTGKTDEPPPRKTGVKVTRKDPETINRGGGGVMTIVPLGPLRPLFEKVRDAQDSAQVSEAVAALAKAEGALDEIKKALKSDDHIYCLRLHRALLRCGDKKTRTATIRSSLQNDSNNYLIYSVLAALEVDKDELREDVLKLAYQPRSIVARALGDALLDDSTPSENVVGPLRDAVKDADRDLKALLGTLLALAGDAGYLVATAGALEHPLAPVKALARKALAKISAGFGPGAEAGAAEWKAWAEQYQTVRGLLVTACARPPTRRESTPKAFEIAAAKKALIEKGVAVLGPMAVFMRDLAFNGKHAGQAVGYVIARVGTPADAEQIAPILHAIQAGKQAKTIVPVLVGALIAGDAKVVGPVVDAMIRIGPPVDSHKDFPDLNQRPDDASVAKLVDYVNGMSKKRKPAGWSLLASLRAKAVEAVVLNNGHEDVGTERELIMARLGSEAVEKQVLAHGKGGAKVAASPNKDAAQVLLGKVGTSKYALPALMKLMLSNPQATTARAVSYIAGPIEGKKLRKIVESSTDITLVNAVLDTYVAIGDRKSVIASLTKRYKTNGPLAQKLKTHLLKLGAKSMRDEAAKKFVAWEASKFKKGAPDFRDVKRLAVCGKGDDAKHLLNFIEQLGRPDWVTMREAVLGLGEMGHKPATRTVSGFIFAEHDLRDAASVASALLGVEESVEAMTSAALNKKAIKRALHEDTSIVAALAYLKPEAAAPIAAKYIPRIILREDPVAAIGLAYALTLAKDDANLNKLANCFLYTIRAMTAVGIAWAAISGEETAPPKALELLRHDPDPLVRAEAAIASAYFKLPSAKLDVGLAIATIPWQSLDQKRGARSMVARLAQTDSIPTPRRALWHAYSLLDRKAFPYRDKLGRGRVREIERGMRRR